MRGSRRSRGPLVLPVACCRGAGAASRVPRPGLRAVGRYGPEPVEHVIVVPKVGEEGINETLDLLGPTESQVGLSGVAGRHVGTG